MADIVDPATRSRMMSGIRGTNTRPEVALRRGIHSRGYRFRLHDRSLPGRPDLVLRRHRAVLFVHGCFWHRHPGCRFATTPATRPEFWQVKFRSNVDRDLRDQAALAARGWRVAVVWECALRPDHLERALELVAAWLESGEGRLDVGEAECRA